MIPTSFDTSRNLQTAYCLISYCVYNPVYNPVTCPMSFTVILNCFVGLIQPFFLPWNIIWKISTIDTYTASFERNETCGVGNFETQARLTLLHVSQTCCVFDLRSTEVLVIGIQTAEQRQQIFAMTRIHLATDAPQWKEDIRWLNRIGWNSMISMFDRHRGYRLDHR